MRVILLSSIIFVPSLFSQDIDDNISDYSSKNGELYLQPLADVFGANINSGLFHSAKIPKFGINFEIGVKLMYAPISAAKKTFYAVEENGFEPPPDQEFPTIFGSEEGVEVPGTDVKVPGVWDTNFFPFAVPQVTIGSVLGTQLVFRYIKLNIDESIGEISLKGWGIRHSISQYIPLCPVDIAASYYRQNFEIGSIVDASASYLGLQVSYSPGIITFYGGIARETSSLDISYTYKSNGSETSLKFELKGENSFRTTLGLSLNLSIVKLHVDYNIASQNVISAGLIFGI